MPIGILTLHTGHNEGAVLQALALSKLLEEVSGEPAEIIDHRYPALHARAYGPADTPRKRAIADFANDHLPLSPKRFEGDHRETWRYAAERYDAVVVGSDEVWKINYLPRLKGLIRLQTDPYCPAYPNVYWPDATAGPRRIAYAATAGTKTDWIRIPERRRRQMAQTLSGFAALGLRDLRTKKFLEWIDPPTAARSIRVPDPTLTVDLFDAKRRESVRKKLETLGVDFSRPRAAVIADTNTAVSDMLANLAAKGIQTVALSYSNSGAQLDLSTEALDPLEWAEALSFFDLCISERMHGCIFSLLNGTPLLALDARKRTMGLPTKNEELVERFGLTEFFFPLHDEARTRPERLLSAAMALLEGSWPGQAIRKHIESERQIARTFLENALMQNAGRPMAEEST